MCHEPWDRCIEDCAGELLGKELAESLWQVLERTDSDLKSIRKRVIRKLYTVQTKQNPWALVSGHVAGLYKRALAMVRPCGITVVVVGLSGGETSHAVRDLPDCPSIFSAIVIREWPSNCAAPAAQSGSGECRTDQNGLRRSDQQQRDVMRRIFGYLLFIVRCWLRDRILTGQQQAVVIYNVHALGALAKVSSDETGPCKTATRLMGLIPRPDLVVAMVNLNSRDSGRVVEPSRKLCQETYENEQLLQFACLKWGCSVELVDVSQAGDKIGEELRRLIINRFVTVRDAGSNE